MASTSLSRTIGTPTSTKILTLSVWFKRSSLNEGRLISSWNGVNSQFWTLLTSDKLFLGDYDGGYNVNIQTNRLFRDTSAWYHLVVACDSTQATASNRVKIYVNGVQETSFSSETYPNQNLDWNFTNSGDSCRIGVRDGGEYFDGLMANIYYVDGQALTPSSFGETDATTGIWKPKAYSGSYGTNGFFLKFENSGSLGTDSSGNGNNFTVNGTPTQTVDTPSNVFATLNPNYQSTFHGTSRAILENGNTKWTGTSNSTSQNGILSTLGANKGKYYVEVKWKGTYDAALGVAKEDFGMMTAGSGGLQSTGWYGMNTNVSATGGSGMAWWSDNSATGDRGTTISTNDIIMMAIDLDNSKLYFGKNGTWEESGVPTSGATGTGATSTLASNTTYLIGCANYGYSTANSWEFNFGNGRFGTTAISSPYSDGAGLGKFQYQPPTGYYSLCTKNINVYG